LLDSTIQAVDAKPKHSMLPVLVVLFLISYGLLAKLVMEQGRTIDSQRSLIRQLFGDSSQLSAMNGKSAQAQHAAGQAHNPKAKPQANTPSTQVKPQGSPSQVTPRNQARNEQSAGKSRKAFPRRPPKAAADEADERRTLVVI
jgi:pyruvate/2-oxoglutarate dehydrogenase complex dihydrolipoamide acyltransferase (E2) component